MSQTLTLDEAEIERACLDDTLVGPAWEPAPDTVRPRDAEGYARWAVEWTAGKGETT